MVNNTQYLTGGKSPNPLSPPTNLAAKSGNGQVTLTWADPPNATSEPSGQTIATWAYTLIVRKEGSQPTGPSDGALVVKSSVRDQYKTSGFVDTGLTNDTLYYYGAFAYNSDKVVSQGAFVSAAPRAGTPLSDLTEGTFIKINENGSPVEFYLAKHNYEPDLNEDGRELIVRISGYDARAWGNTNQFYDTSDIDAWFNTTYKTVLSPFVQSLIGTTSFYYTANSWSSAILTRSVFSLSCTELGQTPGDFYVEGTILPIADTLAHTYIDTSPYNQWTRTSATDIYGYACYVNGSGEVATQVKYSTAWSRPCFTLPATALVDQDLNLMES